MANHMGLNRMTFFLSEMAWLHNERTLYEECESTEMMPSVRLAEVRAAYAHLQSLEDRGVLTIVQNKNRYVDGPTITGYLDANVRVRYRGHIAEVQILIVGMYTLKNDQTPLYNLARTIGLVGPLQPEYACSTANRAFASLTVPAPL